MVMQDLFLFDYGMGIDASGRFRGHLKHTGLRPRFTERLEDLGIRLDLDTVGDGQVAQRPRARR